MDTRQSGAEPVEGRSPISVLNEYQQVKVISGLKFTMSADGPSHLPTFTCTAQATHDGGAVLASASASTKAAAKTAAAAGLLERVDAARAEHAG
ncbi:putative dsRNA-binding protein [Kitasatospora sp. NPDC051164]|uniref:putative dsRNA-binding protein n=1 Tax=Kitasatospora sp. NPDC051164 TaxID=3364055 RepID=UPI0037B7FAC0